MIKVAPCLRKFLDDATKRWPQRNRASDGLLPSAEHHRQNPKSDHETGNAADLTHDIEHGVNCNILAAELVASKDPRIKYIIWNRFIWYPTKGARPQGWSAYHGSNPHTKHIHVSIKPESRDDLRPWPWSTDASEGKATQVRPVLRLHSEGQDVKDMQTALVLLGLMRAPEVDGRFGFHTQASLRLFQQDQRLDDDAVCGPATWDALNRAIHAKG